MRPFRFATVWLSGCSGCHMALLNLHQGLTGLLPAGELVYSPLADIKEYPSEVDLVLVEGAVGTEHDRAAALTVRSRSAAVITLGDCSSLGNVSALRNPDGAAATLETCYGSAAGGTLRPLLLDRAVPLHHIIPVDLHIPGCPPEPEQIRQAVDRVIVEFNKKAHP